jgi:hypothetical protein
MLAPYLNETARFVQNDAVSCFSEKKKKKRAKQCRFERHCSSFFFPWTCSKGRMKTFVFFSLILLASLSPHASA